MHQKPSCVTTTAGVKLFLGLETVLTPGLDVALVRGLDSRKYVFLGDGFVEKDSRGRGGGAKSRGSVVGRGGLFDWSLTDSISEESRGLR